MVVLGVASAQNKLYSTLPERLSELSINAFLLHATAIVIDYIVYIKG